MLLEYYFWVPEENPNGYTMALISAWCFGT